MGLSICAVLKIKSVSVQIFLCFLTVQGIFWDIQFCVDSKWIVIFLFTIAEEYNYSTRTPPKTNLDITEYLYILGNALNCCFCLSVGQELHKHLFPFNMKPAPEVKRRGC